jgi:RimJ/RimL family protein N-acetyltransferase
LTGNNVRLIEVNFSQVSNYQELLNDKENQRRVGDPITKRSMGDTAKWLRKKKKDKTTIIFSVFKGDDFCGYVQVVNIHLGNLTGSFGINLARRWQGHGIGREVMVLLNEYCRSQLNLRKLILHVRADNTSAVRLYEAFNYRTIGYLKDHIIDEDGYHDELIMELFL